MRQAFRRVPVPAEVRAASTPVSLPVPTAGWNTRDQLSTMQPIFALRLDNWVAEDGRLELRAGHEEHATGVTGGVKTLIAYKGTTPKLFAASASAIYDVTSAGATGAAAVSSLSNGRWDATMFSTGGTERLVIANGADGIRTYDGSSWATSSITGATASTLKGITAHKARLWAIEAGTLSAWYMDTVQAISGGMSELNVGPLCARGGELVAVSSWTRDGGSGLDDLFVMVTSEGEVLVYQGTDPSTTSWYLVGRYLIARPIGGTRCLTKVGGSLMVLTEMGIVSMDDVMSGNPATRRVTDAIAPSFMERARAAPTSDVWGVLHHVARQRLIVSVPTPGAEGWQFVYSLRSGAWCRFTGMAGSCWAEHDGGLYFGDDDGTVYLADTGLDDNGLPIPAEVVFSPTDFGVPTVKHFRRVRLHFEADAVVAPRVSVVTDYAAPGDALLSETVTDGSVAATWDEATWDEAEWGGVLRGQSVVAGVFGRGNVGAIRVAVRGQATELRLTGAQMSFEAGRVL